jgi:hypothetical protein
MDAKPDTYQGPELDEAVDERIAQMSYAELRDLCDTFRSWKRIGFPGYNFSKFSEWLRHKISWELV